MRATRVLLFCCQPTVHSLNSWTNTGTDTLECAACHAVLTATIDPELDADAGEQVQ